MIYKFKQGYDTVEVIKNTCSIKGDNGNNQKLQDILLRL